MNSDRFVKVMLVIIAGLLLLNCFKDNGGGISVPFMETKAQASVPAFIQKGKTYECENPGLKTYEVNNIDVNSGWIEVNWNNTRFWQNTAHFWNCRESLKK